MSELIQSYPFPIDKYAIEAKDKYISLKGSNFTMTLTTKEGQTYSANVLYNFGVHHPVLQVYSGTELIQGNTFLRDYPTNLLLCDELNNYGLFYNSIDSVFDFYHLKGWYDHGLNYWQLWEKFKAHQI